jgi:hypothetical protein
MSWEDLKPMFRPEPGTACCAANLIKISKRQFRNRVFLAREWCKFLDEGEFDSAATLARCLGISRARVTQIIGVLTALTSKSWPSRFLRLCCQVHNTLSAWYLPEQSRRWV